MAPGWWKPPSSSSGSGSSARSVTVAAVPGPPLPFPPLADGVVRLRPWGAADVPAMLAAFGDPWFRRFSDWAPDTADAAYAYLEIGRAHV